jgi:hypothetical protein
MYDEGSRSGNTIEQGFHVFLTERQSIATVGLALSVQAGA